MLFEVLFAKFNVFIYFSSLWYEKFIFCIVDLFCIKLSPLNDFTKFCKFTMRHSVLHQANFERTSFSPQFFIFCILLYKFQKGILTIIFKRFFTNRFQSPLALTFTYRSKSVGIGILINVRRIQWLHVLVWVVDLIAFQVLNVCCLRLVF